MSNEERLTAAGWKRLHQPCDLTMYGWSRDGIDWFTEDEALVVVLAAERDAAIARAEAAEALAASRPAISPEDAAAVDSISPRFFDARNITAAHRVYHALHAHAAKVSR